ncbi:retrovirus-related pol polyprotein from transposon TNT 1-94 [Tanacetum coccineum]
MSKQCTKPKRKRDDSWFKDKVLLVQAQANGQILHEEELVFLADLGVPEVQATQSVITHNAAYQADDLDMTLIVMNSTLPKLLLWRICLVLVMPSSEQSSVVNHSETKITSDSNIIPYSQYLQETQQDAIQNSNSSAQQDALILSVIKQLRTQNAEIDRLKQILSEQLREKESLKKTVTVLKDDFKKEESRNLDREIALEKKIKHLDNILEPKLYDGNVIKNTCIIEILDSKETLMLAEESRSKMLLKQQDPMEQAFWSQNSVPHSDPFASSTTSKVEVPKELPKVDTQLNQEIFQRENSVSNQSAPNIDQFFELNELKVQSQEKDKVIMKLKERIKSFSGNVNADKVKMDMDEIETLNIELDHRGSKLIAENEHLKQTYKQLYDSIKPARVRSKEQCDALINQVNQKSVEISDLNAKLQEQGLVITTLKNDLRKLKGKALADSAITSHIIDPKMLKIDMEPITPKLLNKRTAHSAYIKHTQEEATVLRDLVEHVKANYSLDHALEYAFRYTKLIQELLTNISKTCPSINNSGEQIVAVTPKNKDKRVRFIEPVTSSGTTNTNLVSNKPVLSSTGVKTSTSASGSQPSGNTKNDKNLQPPSSTQKNKVEAHPRKVKTSLNNKKCVVEPKGTAYVQHSKLNANSELKCLKCNGCMLFDNHDLCVLDIVNNVNIHGKSKSVKNNSKKKVWKPTGKVFTRIGYTWKLTGRTFTIVGTACPLTRITTTAEVPPRKPIVLEVDTPKPVVTLVYSRKPRKSKTTDSVSKHKVIKSVSANKKEPSKSWGSTISDVPSSSLDACSKFLGTVKFGNDHVAKIMGYGDYQIGNIMLSRVYYMEEGVDLLTGPRGDNLYTLSLGDMMASSPIYLLSKASKTKSWLWHRHMSHLNFGAINHLARHGLVQGLSKLKFEKDHLCSACAMGKSKKNSHKPKSEDTNQEKLYLLYMDLCGLMRVARINGKKYILIIIDDYSWFTWVKCLRSKDEAPDFIIKFLKMIQVRLKTPARRIRTDNGTEFVNQPLREYYEKFGISHETFVARSPQQNGVVERHNRTLIEAACTMLIYAKAPLFLWAEVVAIACYTKNCSMIRLRHSKTPYELLHNKPPDLSFLHVFGALCYPTNDSENLGKL